MSSRREPSGASSGLLRQTRTMLEASAFDPITRMRYNCSVRIGHVPVMAKPAAITASKNVSQPVLETPRSSRLSACLNA